MDSATTYENLSVLENGWFREINTSWDGFSLNLKVEEVLFQQKSPFQDVLVFKSKSFGNVLVLNGIIQCTERDEFTYQEMITHLPMNLHPDPKRVLVIGGGDGGVVREVLKYKSVNEVVLCEIDQMVIDVSKKYLPNMANCLEDPRVTINVADGVEYVRNNPKQFDVIITDAPDPDGVAEGLFQKKYYSELLSCLTDHGLMCCQGETTFLDLPLIKDMASQCKEVFPSVGYAVGNTPTYVSGVMGYLLACNKPDIDFTKPLRRLSEEDVEKMDLKYYTSDIHTAAFSLPNYARKALKGIVNSCT
ncbi:spermidine synthase [Plakobranchus ocellatus]|uniref:Spermidine synthase n=1 Tax=Plakobranchus ocellatus TaxID=259542 RepID=A0AAV4BB27_9GAST|nr:spermidine synthase [Plakobranchus ocellatus]